MKFKKITLLLLATLILMSGITVGTGGGGGGTPSAGSVGLSTFDTDVSDIFGFINGATIDTPSIDVTSDGVDSVLEYEQSGGGDVRLLFSTGVYTIDCTPTCTVDLTEGTDAAPLKNYVYIPISTKVLTASTSDWPSEEYIPVATVEAQSASGIQTDGAYKVHSWTDHTASSADNIGHLAHINYWIRHQPATWESGVALTPSITTNGGSEDEIDIATSAGVVLQLHPHAYPAADTSTGSKVFIVNENGANYTAVTDIEDAADADSAGNAISNNDYVNLVFWGVASSPNTADKLFVNLPSAFHRSSTAATIDAERHSNYTIPADYRGTGFLIARLTLKYTTASSGTWEVVENLDLRDGGFNGGSTAAPTEFVDNVFRILDETDTSKEIAFQASGITTSTTRTITMPDFDVDLADGATKYLQFALVDPSSAVAVETDVGNFEFEFPFTGTITSVGCYNRTAGTTGSHTVDFNIDGSTILSTKVTIDTTEKSSRDAATPAVISSASVSVGDLLTFDNDAIQTTPAEGLTCWLNVRL